MANYPIPQWITPNAALGYGELAGAASRAALNAQLSRERMAQESVQTAIEAQARSQQLAQQTALHQQELNRQHTLDQQRIAIDQAYKQQVIDLRGQDEALAQQEFIQKTKQAADRFTATQNFQKALLPTEQGGEGLSPDKAALKYISPYMTGDALGRLASSPGKFTLGAPVNIPGIDNKKALQTSPNHFQLIDTPVTSTNAPEAVPVEGDDGTIGYWVTPPGGGKAHWTGRQKTSGLEAAMKAYQAQKGGSKDEDKAAPERKAEGGYKVGTVYKGGLRYLGGNPQDESSWEKVK